MPIKTRQLTNVLITGAAVLLSMTAFALPAQASPSRHTPPSPVTTSSPAPAPAPTVISVSGSTTRLGSNFSAGGYPRVSYTVKVPTAGFFVVRYSSDVAGSAVNTTVDGLSLTQVIVAAGTPVSTDAFALGVGTHTVTTQSPDGYGLTTIELVRVH